MICYLSADALGAAAVSFERLLAESDFVICLAALNDSTKGVFDAAAFSKMKKDAIFINVSRGGITLIIYLLNKMYVLSDK